MAFRSWTWTGFSATLKPKSSVLPSVRPRLMPPPASQIGEGVLVMVAAGAGLGAVAGDPLPQRRAAELAAPDHQRARRAGRAASGPAISAGHRPDPRPGTWPAGVWPGRRGGPSRNRRARTMRTPRSTSRRASRQLLANVGLARPGAVHLQRGRRLAWSCPSAPAPTFACGRPSRTG